MHFKLEDFVAIAEYTNGIHAVPTIYTCKWTFQFWLGW